MTNTIVPAYTTTATSYNLIAMEVSTYLERIHYTSHVKPDIETLFQLQTAHMRHVPFENLDIRLKRPIQLSDDALWKKIIIQKRGGFCYELNGLFAWLLKQIGYDVTYLNARVFDRDGNMGIEFDHLALLVRIPGQPESWLADVGFGDSFNEPLNFEVYREQAQGLRAYKIEPTSAGFITWQKNYDGTLERQYFFDLTPCQFPEDYLAGCDYHQTSPDSWFTRGSIISRATTDGRISLEDRRIILTRNGQRTERIISTDEEYRSLLKEHFAVEL